MRKHPRFITHEEVRLEVEGRNDLRPVWMQDISKGGLFVQTADPPPLRARVHITIETPDGALTLCAEVVHVLPGEYGGVGLQFLDLTPERRQRIEAYVEGLAAGLDDSKDSGDLTSVEAARIQDAVTRFLKGFESENLYAALDLAPEASGPEVEACIEEMKSILDTKPRKLPPATAARLTHARTILSKVSMLMRDPKRRRDYDFRHGHVFPERRIVEARTPDRVQVLRDEWQMVHRDRVDAAQRVVADAIRAVNKLDYEAAVEAGEAALVDDPFNLELRDAMREWKNRLAKRAGPMPNAKKRSA